MPKPDNDGRIDIRKFYPPVPPLKPPTAAHGRLAAELFSRASGVFVFCEDEDSGSPDPPADPFLFDSPLFAMLGPHLQMKLLVDVARWTLCADAHAPAVLSAGHVAALWATFYWFGGKIDVEIDDVGVTEVDAARAGVVAPPRPPLNVQERRASIEDMMARGRLHEMHERATAVRAEGGDIAALGLADLPPIPPEPISKGLHRRSPPPDVVTRMLSLIAPRGTRGCSPALPSPWNRARRVVVDAHAEYVRATMPRGTLLAINADDGDSGTARFMLNFAFRGLFGELGNEALLNGHVSIGDVARLRRLQALARTLNAAYDATLAADPAMLARDYADLLIFSRHGTFLSAPAPEPEASAVEALAADIALWEKRDKARGVDTHKEWACLPNLSDLEHHRPAAVRADGAAQRQYYIDVANLAAKLSVEGVPERPLHECVAEHARSCGGSGERASPGKDDNDDAAAGATAHYEERAAAEAAILTASCGFLLPIFKEGSIDVLKRDVLKRSRFQRMLGEYHAAMARMHGGAGEDALERAYDSFDARIAAVRSIEHPVAAAWLELNPPAKRAADVRADADRVGMQCAGCEEYFALDALSVCAACKFARYCSVSCQRADWKKRHKTICAVMRTGAAGGAAAYGGEE